MLERVVLVRRAKREVAVRREARNLARAEARARALQGAATALSRLAEDAVWAHRDALHGALAAAEAAAAHADLPEGWADAPDCAPQLRAARAQLAALEEEEALAAAEKERRSPPTLPTPSAAVRGAPLRGVRAEHRPSARPAAGARHARLEYAERLRRAAPPPPAPPLEDPTAGHPPPPRRSGRRRRRVPARAAAASAAALRVAGVPRFRVGASTARARVLPYLRLVCGRAAVEVQLEEGADTANARADAADGERARHWAEVAAAAKAQLAEVAAASTGASFVALLGDDAPEPPPPATLPPAALDAVIEKSRTTADPLAREGARWLRAAYEMDDNAEPPELVLRRPPARARHQREWAETARARETLAKFARAVAADGGKHAAVAAAAGACELASELEAVGWEEGGADGAPEPKESGGLGSVFTNFFGLGGGKPLGDGAETRVVVAVRTFADPPRKAPAAECAHELREKLEVYGAPRRVALHTFAPPWLAGGLEPAGKAAHRMYLRAFADAAADSLTDSLLAAAAAAPVAAPSPLADELCEQLRAAATFADEADLDAESCEALDLAADFLRGALRAAPKKLDLAAVGIRPPPVETTPQPSPLPSPLPSPPGESPLEIGDDGDEPPAAAGCLACFKPKRRQPKPAAPLPSSEPPLQSPATSSRRRGGAPAPAAAPAVPLPAGGGLASSVTKEPQLTDDAAAAPSPSPAAGAKPKGKERMRFEPRPRADAAAVVGGSRALVFAGPSGSGKTTLIAAAAREAAKACVALGRPAARAPVVCVRFGGLTAAASELPAFLFSICCQLAAAYDAPPPALAEASQLPRRWGEWLSLATEARPLLLLDGVDAHLGDSTAALRWLPLPQPPPSVRLVLTCDDKALASLPPLAAGCVRPLPPLHRSDAMRALRSRLASAGRRLQPSQTDAVLAAAGATVSGGVGCRPLHLALLGSRAARWTSSLAPPQNLSRSAEEEAAAIVARAEAACGAALVAGACGLLCAARDGLSVAELQHALSCDDGIVASLVAAAPRPPPLARVPPAALRLLLTVEIAPLLRQSDAAAHGGAPLLRWRTSLGRRVASKPLRARRRRRAPPPSVAQPRGARRCRRCSRRPTAAACVCRPIGAAGKARRRRGGCNAELRSFPPRSRRGRREEPASTPRRTVDPCRPRPGSTNSGRLRAAAAARRARGGGSTAAALGATSPSRRHPGGPDSRGATALPPPALGTRRLRPRRRRRPPRHVDAPVGAPPRARRTGGGGGEGAGVCPRRRGEGGRDGAAAAAAALPAVAVPPRVAAAPLRAASAERAARRPRRRGGRLRRRVRVRRRVGAGL